VRTATSSMKSRSVSVHVKLCAILLSGMFAPLCAFAQPEVAAPDLTGAWVAERDYVFKMVRPDGDRPPLQEWALEFSRASREKFRAGKPPPNNNQKCLPPSFMRQLQSNFPMMIVQTKDEMTFLFEENTRVYRVHMNKPADANTKRSWVGHSSGRWDGETLVVETVNAKPATFIVSLTGQARAGGQNNSYEIPYTEALKITHRLRLIDGGERLENVSTLEDPNTYTKPWEVITIFRKLPDRMREYVCAENNVNLDFDE
jgi:hypothetical protein